MRTWITKCGIMLATLAGLGAGAAHATPAVGVVATRMDVVSPHTSGSPLPAVGQALMLTAGRGGDVVYIITGGDIACIVAALAGDLFEAPTYPSTALD